MFQRVGEAHRRRRARRCTTSTTRAAGTSRCGPRAPPSVVRAFVAAPADHAVEGLVRRARTSATSARRRAGTASTTSSASRSLGVDDPDVDVEVIALAGRLLPRRSGCAGVALLLNSMGDAGDRPALRRRAARLPRRATPATLGAEHREHARAPTRCGCSTRSGPRRAGRRSSARRRSPTTSSDESPRALRARCRPGCDALGIAVRARRRGSCAASTTTRARRSSSRRDALDAAQNAIGGGGRYDGLAEELGGPPHARHRVRLGHRARPARVRRRGRVRRAADGRVDVFVVDIAGGDAARDAHRRAARRRASRADRAFDGRSHEGADEGGRPLRRARSP